VSRLHTVRVFCADDGSGGNPLAVFLHGGDVPPSARQAVAADLARSETVFVDDAATGEVRIFSPAVEMPFAGHPAVGTAWLLARESSPVASLRVPAGELRVRYADGASFVAARPDWSPQFEWERLGSPADVDALAGPPEGHDQYGAWAWLDERAGTVRARVFPVRLGIQEDEATGSAVVLLCSQLARPIDVRQGRGSRIRARPLDDGYVEVGGRSVLDGVSEYDVAQP
jgi:predicted PhzF superfamily epimerase YddE/YHI9